MVVAMASGAMPSPDKRLTGKRLIPHRQTLPVSKDYKLMMPLPTPRAWTRCSSLSIITIRR